LYKTFSEQLVSPATYIYFEFSELWNIYDHFQRNVAFKFIRIEPIWFMTRRHMGKRYRFITDTVQDRWQSPN